ncbi:crotonase/enoyl-CoA hydratase family protein [Ketobacter sp.]|uniref:crotonase/enoyl-CoA hydratase family protein n=1 Tax=Ketobacter sp. TaxID=2083498 RepID=UPI000F1E5AF2|nr:crotonase/enoyl-CoA hydratase family protein [Ketobacter sp.]RLU00224.1 MAG: crotonase/enoyl-CoA hydratase family protein [Ketobacter sp.]
MTIRIEKQDAITTIVLDRTQVRNAVDRTTAQALADAFRAFENDADASVAVLVGEHTFCAGADLKAVSSGSGSNRLEPDGDGPMGPSRMLLSKPVIAAIEGHAVAGGLELALWCDMRVAADNATLGVFCRRFGVPLIDGGTVRLPRLIGMSRALDLILTGRAVSAQEALAMGLVNRICAPGAARATAEQLAHEISRFPQLCMRHDRLSAYQQWDLDLPAALRNEFELGLQTIASGETVAGATRFREGKGRHGEFDGES